MKIIAINHSGGKPQRDKQEYSTIEQAKIAYGSRKFPAKLILDKAVFIPAIGYITIKKVPNDY